MKDIYDFFNDVDIEVNEFQPMEADELEKSRIKKRVREKIQEHSPESGSKKRIHGKVAAAAVLFATGIGCFGWAFPSYAKEVPVIGDIFRFLDGGTTGIYDLYQEKALNIDMTKAAKGIEVTLNQGVYDGRTLSLTYTIKTGKDLGEDLYLREDIEVPSVTGYGGSQQLKQVSPGVYVGQSNYNLFTEKEERNALSFRWVVSSIESLGEEGFSEEKAVDCNFNYNVTLKAMDSKSLELADNHSTIQKVRINIERLTMTPINTILYYSEESPKQLSDYVGLDWEIKDDLGNIYEYDGNGGSGETHEKILKMNSSLTIQRLNPEAKTLFVTPILQLGNMQGGGVAIEDDGTETHFTLDALPEGVTPGEWHMKQISIDLSSIR
ncbi:DUF4179 domain-containing protein [Aminipila butyrica]|uniref:DUF4179 domain-containing protein n=1 Tax=Aminipila butyrica TaxID=433296 RepID=A0A858BT38_9FIRM|nr:DUF4179 domain-containing protein [Aminipila butyrica]QIB68110.1 DUF4179 domain-containing protein [Aminipila butyrica]